MTGREISAGEAVIKEEEGVVVEVVVVPVKVGLHLICPLQGIPCGYSIHEAVASAF